MKSFELRIDGRVVKGPLPEFIGKKLSFHREPERRGTAKGDPIGFGSSKYLCALYALTNLTQKEISEQTGVSYGVLRKWHWEESFKRLIDELEEEFTMELIRQFEKTQAVRVVHDDGRHYGDGVREKLLDRFVTKITGQEFSDYSDERFIFMHEYFQLTDVPGGRRMGSGLRQKVENADVTVFHVLYRMVMPLVRKKKLNEAKIALLEEIMSLIKKLYERRSRAVANKA